MKNQLSLSETVPLKVNDNEDIHQETYVSIASLKNVSFREDWRLKSSNSFAVCSILYRSCRFHVRPGYKNTDYNNVNWGK